MTNAPCKDCTDRIVGCHSTCEKYKLFRSDLDDLNHSKRLENFEYKLTIERVLSRKKSRGNKK